MSAAPDALPNITQVAARVGDRQRIVEVVLLIDKRVAAPVAAECLVDHSPPPPPVGRSARTGRR